MAMFTGTRNKAGQMLAKQPYEPIPSLKGVIQTEGAVQPGRPKKKAKAKRTGGMEVH